MMKQHVWLMTHFEECPPQYDLIHEEVFISRPQPNAIIRVLKDWKLWDQIMANEFQKLIEENDKASAYDMSGMAHITITKQWCRDPYNGEEYKELPTTKRFNDTFQDKEGFQFT